MASTAPPSKRADGTPQTLESALLWIMSAPSHRGRRLAKSDLLSVFTQLLPGQADNAFVQLRYAAKHGGRVGQVWVRVEGERRGTRYEFFADEPPPSSSMYPEREVRPARVGGMREFEPPTPPAASGGIEVFLGDNLQVLKKFEQRSFDLIYIDPPFNLNFAHAACVLRSKTRRCRARAGNFAMIGRVDVRDGENDGAVEEHP